MGTLFRNALKPTIGYTLLTTPLDVVTPYHHFYYCTYLLTVAIQRGIVALSTIAFSGQRRTMGVRLELANRRHVLPMLPSCSGVGSTLYHVQLSQFQQQTP